MANKHGSYTSVWSGEEFNFDTNDYIFYSRLLEDGERWAAVGRGAIARFNSIPSLIQQNNTVSQMDIVASNLIAMGKAERTNEIAILQEYLSTTDKIDIESLDEKQLVTMVNQAFNIQKLWKRAGEIMKKNFTEANQQYEKENNIKLLETQLNSYLIAANKIAYQRVDANIRKAIANRDDRLFKQSFDDYLTTLNAILTDDMDKLGLNGDAINDRILENLDFLKEVFNEVKGFRQAFGIQILNKYTNGNYDIEKIKGTFQKRKKGGHWTTAMHRAMFGAEGKDNTKRYSSIAEQVGASILSLLAGAFNTQVGDFSLTTADLGQAGGMANIDEFFMRGAGSISFALKDDYDLNKTGAMAMIADMERQYRDSGVENKLAIYESTKLYWAESLDGHGFHGTEYGYKGTVSLLTERGYSNAHDFIQKVFNTMKQAILEGQQEVYKEELKNVILQEIAAFLFDDAWNIGKSVEGSDFKALHVFRLENTLVPVSTLLIGMGTAMKDTSSNYKQWANVKVNMEEEIMYPEPPNKIKYTHANWVEQLEAAQESFSVSIDFFKNFKSTIASYIG